MNLVRVWVGVLLLCGVVQAQERPCRVQLGQAGFIDLDCSALSGGDLQQVPVTMQIDRGRGLLRLSGSIDGNYDPQAGISFVAKLELADDFVYEHPEVSATLSSGGTVTVHVEQSRFKFAEISNVTAEVEASTPSGPLKLGGTLSSGKYHEDGRIDFDGSLDLREDFTYDRSPVTATLGRGSSLTLHVEQSTFRNASLDGVAIDTAILVGGKKLKVNGTITNGAYKPDGKIDFHGRLDIVEDFTYERGRVKVTLKAGGALDVDVAAGEPQVIAFAGVPVVLCISVFFTEIKLRAFLLRGIIPLRLLNSF